MNKLPRESLQFAKAIATLTESELLKYIKKEKQSWYLKRLFTRYSKLRAKRELNEYLEKIDHDRIKRNERRNSSRVKTDAKRNNTTKARKATTNRTTKHRSKKSKRIVTSAKPAKEIQVEQRES